MIRTLIMREILGGVRSFRFVVVALILAVLVSSSLVCHVPGLCAASGELCPFSSPEDGEKTMIAPPAVLSIFVKGLDEVIGRSYALKYGGQITPGGTPKISQRPV